MRSRTCRQVKREEAAVRRSQMGSAFDPVILEQLLAMEAAHLQGEVSRVYGGQEQPEPTAPERGAGAEEREAWEEELDEDERMANRWYENAAYGSVVDPVEGSDDVGGSLGRGNPSTPRIGTRARDNSRSPRGKKQGRR